METKPKTTAAVQGATAKASNDATVKQLAPQTSPEVHAAFNLAKTIKTVEELHNKIRHRDKLEIYTQKLKDFEFKKTEENLDDKTSYYTGCKLEIRDEEQRTFEIKHPGIIKEVVEFLAARFDVRLKEIEASIKLPLGNVA